MRKYCGYCGSKVAAESAPLSGDTSSKQEQQAGQDVETIEAQAGVFTALTRSKPVIIWGDGDWSEYGDKQEKELNRVLEINNAKFTREAIAAIGKAEVLQAIKKAERYAHNKKIEHSMEVLMLVPESIENQLNSSFIPTKQRAVPNRKAEEVGDIIINVKQAKKEKYIRCIPYLASLANSAVGGKAASYGRRRLTSR